MMPEAGAVFMTFTEGLDQSSDSLSRALHSFVFSDLLCKATGTNNCTDFNKGQHNNDDTHHQG